MQYDAIEQPDPEIWLELDETERADLVFDYHRRIGVQLETSELHTMPSADRPRIGNLPCGACRAASPAAGAGFSLNVPSRTEIDC